MKTHLRRKITAAFAIIGFVAASFLFFTQAATTIINDTFADGNSRNQDLANNSLQLFSARTAFARTDAVGSVNFAYNSGSSDAYWAHFTALNEPVTLNVGDSITFTTVTALTFATARTGSIRFGLFDSAGSRRLTDAGSGINDANFGNDVGYAAEIFPHTSNFATLWRRDMSNPPTNNIFNSMGAAGDGLSQLSATASTTAMQTFTSGSDYTLTYTVTRTGATTTEITYRAVGPGIDKSVTATETSSSPYTKFDYFIFRTGGTSLADSIRFKQFKVEFAPAAPMITTQPQPSNQTVAVNSDVQFAVAASGSNLSYQWLKNGTAITGNASATTATLQLTRVQTSDSGSYTVRVSNSGGSVVSDAVNLTVSSGQVDPPPVITQQPQNTTATVGTAATLSVTATGDNLTYQWFKNGVLIDGATNSTLNFPSVQNSDTGNYTVTIINPYGSVTSDPARLTVISTIAPTAFFPANTPTGICADVPLSITFNQTPRLGTTGRIRIYKADGTLVDTIDLSAATQTRNNGGVNFNYYPVIINGNTANIYPHQTLAYNQNYYVTIEAGVFTDSTGTPFGGFSDAATFTFTTKTAAPAAGTNVLTVAANNSGDFCTIQAAVDFVPANNAQRVVINVKNGTYTEIVYVPSNKPLITVRGESRTGAIQQYANNNNLNGAVSGNYRTSFGVDAADFNLENITLHNITPQGGSQAEAFRTNGGRTTVNTVTLLSFQDTILTQKSAYVANSYIEGDVDFTWGNGATYYVNSELKSLRDGGFYSQIRNSAANYGNVYVNCKLTKGAGVTMGNFLGRIDPDDFPYSQVVLIDTQMDTHIAPVGWQFNNPTNPVTAANYPNIRYWESGTTDLNGAAVDCSPRHPISRSDCRNPLTAEERDFYRNPTNITGFTPQTKLTALVSLTNTTQVYDGTPKPVTVTTDPAGLAVDVTYNGSPTVPTNVGTYTVAAAINDANYQGSATGTLTITKRTVTITYGNTTQIFDGSPKAVSVTTNPPNVAVTVTYNGSPTAPTAIGNYTVAAAVNDPNYTGTATANLNIRSNVKAFPTAEGAGEYTVGGRGGDTYHVTNLNDSGAGSLRNGITSANGARTIVFDLSGTIYLTTDLKINKPFITIAGQTAPGDGITVAGRTTMVDQTQHVIIRYLRFRGGDINCNSIPSYQGDSFWVDKSKDVIVDHVSSSWSVDETLSVTESDRVTVQWAFITESLNTSCHQNDEGTAVERHGYGSLIRYGDGRISFHHNFYAHHYNRNPRVGDNITLDFVNNIIYDWGTDASYSGPASEGTTKVNYIGNYLVAGPNTPSGKRTRAFSGGSVNTLIYQNGNVIDSNLNGTHDGANTGWAMFIGNYTPQNAPLDLAGNRYLKANPSLVDINADTAETAYTSVLNMAGSSRFRDAVDARNASEARNETGILIDSQTQVGGYPTLNSTAPPVDTDGDGIPDSYETSHGLDPNNPNDAAAIAANGLSNLENYLNSAFFVPTAADAAISGRVITADGRGIARAQISIVNLNGVSTTTNTNPFGYFRLSDVAVGESYFVTVRSKNYSFSTVPQVLTLNEDLNDLIFIADR